ncbi:MAG: AmmeMemoRadiSam system radical SAM enzyme [Candidatus Omnitrophota bacterium]
MDAGLILWYGISKNLKLHSKKTVKEALFYEPLSDHKVKCNLCPHACKILPGKCGFCRVRENQKGKLYSLIYSQITSLALDPIEKKPLYHFHPGEYILSVGTKGCNLSCPFCQNWSISQKSDVPLKEISPGEIIRKAKQYKSFGIAYTYNEPFVWYEFVLDTAILARKEGLKNVLVTNGYINPRPLDKIIPFIDAMNIDLKSMENEFYRKFCQGNLENVLATIKRASGACHVELTNLVIPGLNDKDENFIMLVDWVLNFLGPKIPMHFSRYFPCYRMDLPPTPPATLKRAEAIARKKLKYVYLGNL